MGREAWRVESGEWGVERGGKPSGRHLFTLHTSRFTFLKKIGLCGELGEKKCLPLPMNRVMFFQNHV